MSSFYKANSDTFTIRNWKNLIPKADANNDVELIESKKGALVCKYQDQFIHSKYDPYKEAETIISQGYNENASLIFVFGLGYAYHIQTLLEKIADKAALIFIFEYSEEIFESAFNNISLNFLLDTRCYLFLGGEPNDMVINILSQLPISKLSGVAAFFLTNNYRLFKNSYDKLYQKLSQLLQQNLQNRLTNLEFDKIWLKNHILNLKYLFRDEDISVLENHYQNRPVVIVSAGPSLRYSLKELEKKKDFVYIMAVDTALPSLLEMNIIPDFLVSVDGQLYNYYDFFTIQPEHEMILFYDLSVYPTIPEKVIGKHFYFTVHSAKDKRNFLNWMSKELQINLTELSSGSSVSSTCLSICELLGFDKIYLLGQDLAYTDLISHCASSPVYNIFNNQSNRCNTLESQFYRHIIKRKGFAVEKNKITDPSLHSFKLWLNEFIAEFLLKNAKVSVFNCTFSGLNLTNAKRLALENISEKELILNNLNETNKIQNIIRHSNLSNLIKEMEIALIRFIQFLARELDSEKTSRENIILAKRNIEEIYPFLTTLYAKEDLWFFRKEIINDNDLYLYINTIISSSKKILKSIEKLKNNLS